MIQFYVDFNDLEAPDVVGIRFDIDRNSAISEQELREGMRALLYDETVEIQATLWNGDHYKWVGQLDRQTIKDIPEAEWNRLDKK